MKKQNKIVCDDCGKEIVDIANFVGTPYGSEYALCFKCGNKIQLDALTSERNKLNRQISTLKKATLTTKTLTTKEMGTCRNCLKKEISQEYFPFCSEKCQEEKYNQN